MRDSKALSAKRQSSAVASASTAAPAGAWSSTAQSTLERIVD
jgi:hypothetical protein